MADIDGDGRPEIAVCEVGADIGQLYGRLALFRPGANPEDLWQAQVLHDRLADAHSLQVADFDGDGRPDIYVGEMGLTDWPHAQQRIFLSRGDRMEEHIIDAGVGTHEAQVIELDGRVGIVSKPNRSLQDRLSGSSGAWRTQKRPAQSERSTCNALRCGFPRMRAPFCGANLPSVT